MAIEKGTIRYNPLVYGQGDNYHDIFIICIICRFTGYPESNYEI